MQIVHAQMMRFDSVERQKNIFRCLGDPIFARLNPFKKEVERMSDLIDRQQVIDAVKGRFSMPVDNLIVEVVEAVPSTEPEIIRCKDCKHFEYDHLYIIQGIPVLGHEVCNAWGDGCKTDENGYCFMAERRTDG